MSEELAGLLGERQTLGERLRMARDTLGERLRMAREYMGLKRDEVTKHLSIPQGALTRIETGQRKVDALELARLAKLYRRPESWFTDEPASWFTDEDAFPPEVALVTRAAASLSAQDRRELAHFADFLESRARSKLSRDG